jgi:hypothetical protein
MQAIPHIALARDSRGIVVIPPLLGGQWGSPDNLVLTDVFVFLPRMYRGPQVTVVGGTRFEVAPMHLVGATTYDNLQPDPEPDDTTALAVPLQLPALMNGHIDHGEDVDWFSITVPPGGAGRRLVARTFCPAQYIYPPICIGEVGVDVAGAGYTYGIYAADGVTLLSSSTATIDLSAPVEAGQYFIKASYDYMRYPNLEFDTSYIAAVWVE